jgi:hypothetical protein
LLHLYPDGRGKAGGKFGGIADAEGACRRAGGKLLFRVKARTEKRKFFKAERVVFSAALEEFIKFRTIPLTPSLPILYSPAL